MVLVGVIDPDCWREIELLPHNIGKEEYACNVGHPLGHLLLLPCIVIKVNEKLQLDPGLASNGPDT